MEIEMRLFLSVFMVIILMSGAALAGDFVVNDNVNLVLDILQQVLDVIVKFIGDILDEFVRAIKDLLSGGEE